MVEQSRPSRRRFLLAGTATGSGLFLAGLTPIARADQEKEAEEEVSPAEDLMREHGVLNRILLIYEETNRRLYHNEAPNIATLRRAAGIVRSFVEDYHEKLEEDHLFPRFQKAGKLLDLVDVLRKQHQAGRILTDRITEMATDETIAEQPGRRKLAGSIAQFVRMYRPHEAREDTVLFPALREIVPEREYDELGEQFEELEHKLFGKDGFHSIVAQVAELEKTLDIYDLAKFTPQV